jgi:hypothetical protein
MGADGYRAGRGVVAAAVVAGLAGLGAAGPAGAVTAAAGAVRAAGSWGKAIEVPGLGVLNKGGEAEVNAVSCVSPGYCAAGGDYIDATGVNSQGFVASERNGHWGKATEVPGLQALNTGGLAEVVDVSCTSPGNCAAGGDYANGPGGDDIREFVVSERNGRWGKAAEIHGPGGLNAGADAEDMSLSCGSAGNCAAGGEYYVERSGNYQGFVAVEQNGRWGTAIEVPGLGALNTGGLADVASVSCGLAGYCAAGGYYQDNSGIAEGFVVAGRNGHWGTAIEVPGLGALNAGATPYNLSAAVGQVSCASAGNCAAGGYYADRSGRTQGFLVTERNGHWGKATEVPGLGALNAGGTAAVFFSVSCASAGNCAAGGTYTDRHHRGQGFLVTERNGHWGKATEVPGLGALNAGATADNNGAEVNAVSCASAGNCAAAGSYADRSGRTQGFVADERNGRWSKAIQIPGLQALNTGGSAQVSALSCGPAGNCAAGGSYTESPSPYRFQTQGFVVSRSS